MAVRKACGRGIWNEIGIAEARSALAWWLEAGVDVAVQEDPRDWLKPLPAPVAARAEAASAPNVAEPDPETLADAPIVAGKQRATAARVRRPRGGSCPTGRKMRAVMLLSDRPTLEDAAAGQPIGGMPGT